jgi:DNA (cytosine-5)-methyltransferase 1
MSTVGSTASRKVPSLQSLFVTFSNMRGSRSTKGEVRDDQDSIRLPGLRRCEETLGTIKEMKATVQVIDLFSGCGGMSFGFKTARTQRIKFEVLGGLDVDKHANATYKRMVKAPALHLDVRTLTQDRTLKQCLSVWGRNTKLPLILIGCAPCQGFSSHRKKDSRTDDRNELLHSFANVIATLKPDLVIMENVPEMLAAAHWRHFAGWTSKLRSHGYKTRTRIYNLAQFGLPQERYRALVIATRAKGGIAMPNAMVPPSEFMTVRDAIAHLPPLAAGGIDPTDPMHFTSKHRPTTVDLIRRIPKDGGSRRSLPDAMGPSCLKHVDGFRDVYGRLWWDRPAVAITARCRTPSCGRFTHPEQDRGLSVREAALLQGFPFDYYFEGPFDDKFKQIGNAVSPLFSRALAKHIDSKWNSSTGAWSEATESDEDVKGPITKSFSSSIASLKRKLREKALSSI